MTEASAGDQQMRRIGMIDRRQDAAFCQIDRRIDRAAAAQPLHQLGHGGPLGDCRLGQIEDRVGAPPDDP